MNLTIVSVLCALLLVNAWTPSVLQDGEFGVVSRTGNDPDRPSKVNQDAYFSFEDPTYIGIGVLDGHGKRGPELNAYLKKRLPEALSEQLLRVEECQELDSARDDNVANENALGKYLRMMQELAKIDLDEMARETENSHEKSLVRAFHSAHVCALEAPGVPAARSGTTAVVGLHSKKERKLYVAFVGDSSALLLEKRQGASWTGKSLTIPTTTRVEQERLRIDACDGRIDGSGNVWYGPVGIAMTRALGDAVMLRAGVIPSPMTSTIELDPLSTYIVMLVTDGVSDVLSLSEILDIVQSADDEPAEDVASKVVEVARSKWRNDLSIETRVDDATCVVLYIFSEIER